MAHILSDANALIPKHTFIRSYQACVPCRKRKVKCDLGDPGSPSDPPCRRCRREHKECYFQDLRTKKGPSTTTREVPRSAKRTRSESTLDSPTVQPHTASSASANPLDELFQPTSSTSTTQHVSAISPNDSTTADRILHKEVHNANEALNLLFEAAAESRSDTDDGNGNQTFDPRFSNQNDSNSLAWRDFWCVKAGWMTAIEARHYVDLFLPFTLQLTECSFFENLNPLAPLISPALKSDHTTLVQSEHALANTILTIAARYYTLPGIGGASRSYAIHDRLWRYTRGLLSKLPFSGSRTVRKYGMVESLLLLTEWHPRNYHFPDDDTVEEQWIGDGIPY